MTAAHDPTTSRDVFGVPVSDVIGTPTGDIGRVPCACGKTHPRREHATTCSRCWRSGVWSFHALCDRCLAARFGQARLSADLLAMVVEALDVHRWTHPLADVLEVFVSFGPAGSWLDGDWRYEVRDPAPCFDELLVLLHKVPS